MRDACLIIPVYNEAQVIRGVVNSLSKYFDNIVCVDDGSKDGSHKEIAKTKAVLLRHPVNLGQGGALQTGLEYARTHLGVDYFVTFDADGQHRVEDAVAMLNILRNGEHDVVMGSRFIGDEKNQSNIPVLKRLLLRFAVMFSNRTSGLKLTDTHNGLRAFNRWFAEQLQITMLDMSHASEIIETVATTGARWLEHPVTINYTAYSMAKGQSMVNAINIVFDSMLKRFTR